MRLIRTTAVWLLMAASASSAHLSESGLMCTLTGQKIDACCCQLNDGKLYCPLAKTYIDACCCKGADQYRDASAGAISTRSSAPLSNPNNRIQSCHA